MTEIGNTVARFLLLACLLLLAPLAVAQTSSSTASDVQQAEADEPFNWTVLTNSPADTLSSFNRMAQQLETGILLYEQEKTPVNSENLLLSLSQLHRLFDFSKIALISRQDVGLETLGALLDVFNRIGYPDSAAAPDTDEIRTGGYVAFSIPGTPFRVTLIPDGDRAGEWVFEGRTVETAPSFLKGVSARPVAPEHEVKDWSLLLQQLTGPHIPIAFVNAFPVWMNQPFLGTPIWKALVAIAMCLGTVFLLFLWFRLLPKPREGDTGAGRLFVRVLGPLVVNLTFLILLDFFRSQLNLTGSLWGLIGVSGSVIYWVTLAWAFWLINLATAERIMEKTNVAEGSLDANMLNLCTRVFGIVGSVIILAFGAQAIGVPVLSMLAGLGIGGVAVALAAQPTLQNLIGGIILFLDKPVRVGEYCTYGDKSGTVEKIGARSTQIRALDRTVVTVPNSSFADKEIINWSRCDRLHINQTIGLRYDTSTEQVQYILAKIREIFLSHPKIFGPSGRAMFTGYSETSLNIIMQAYVDSPWWTEYFAVREDVLLRVQKVIEESGTYYAVPTKTVYFQRDKGIDQELSTQVEKELDDWRSKGEFPFPRFSEDVAESFQGQIEYPVPGSPDYAPPEPPETEPDEKT